jgi:hypothetical protein
MARINMRLGRSKAFAAAIMAEIEDLIPECDKSQVHGRLLRVLHDNGAAWTTDEDRAAMGLQPRDELGWTPSERVKYEQDRMAAMTEVASFVVKLNDVK